MRQSDITIQLYKPKPTEGVFFLSYCLFLTYLIFGSSFFLIYISSLWKPVFVFCIALLVIRELFIGRFYWKNIVPLLVILFLAYIVFRIAGGMLQNSIAATLLYAYSARNISFKKIAQYTIIITSVIVFIIVISAYLGIIQNYISIDHQRYREYLGFRYALYGPTFISNITMLWVYIKKDKSTVISLLVLFLVNYFFFIKTNSRLDFYLTCIFLLATILMKRKVVFSFFKQRVISLVMVSSYIWAAGISFLMVYLYRPSSNIMFQINTFFGNRLYLAQKSLLASGAHYFGDSSITWVGNGLDMYGHKNVNPYTYVDCFYIQVLQRFGIAFFVIIILLLTYALYKCYKKEETMLLIIMTFVALHCMVDDLLLYPYYNTFWLAIGIVLTGSFENKVIQRKQLNQT